MEIQFLYTMQKLHAPLLDEIMLTITHLGDSGVVWLVVAAFLLCSRRYRRVGVLLLVALAFDVLLCNVILKPLVARTRPYDAFEGLKLLLPPEHDFSFPSGHTAASFAAATALSYGNRKFAFVAWPLALAIAFSRLYLCVHYPSDVLAGAAIGALCGFAALAVFKCARKRKRDVDLANGAQT